jgi:osmotically-inducible protein OsmY
MTKHSNWTEPSYNQQEHWPTDGDEEPPLTDESIRACAMQKLAENPLIPAGVEVTVREGVLALTGTVPDEATRDLAATVAKLARGVRRLDNRLHLPLSGAV